MKQSGVKNNFSSRADAIQSLAAAFGAAPETGSINIEQHYDKATGTYYCHGKMYSKLFIEETKAYLMRQKTKFGQMGPEHKGMAMAYDLSYEAVCALSEDDVTRLQNNKTDNKDQT